MLLLHAEIDEGGNLFLGAEKRSVEEEGGVPLEGDDLLAAVQDVVWYADGFLPFDAARPSWIRPTWPNLLMFLSDVRGRRFKRGIFLADDLLAAVEEFRRAAHAIASGHCLPTLVKQKDGFVAAWKPLEDGSSFFVRCVDELARRAGRTLLETGGRCETAEDAWLAALRADDPHVIFDSVEDLRDLATRLDVWRAPLAVSAANRAALRFVLVPPRTAAGQWRLDYAPPVSRMGLVALGQAVRLFPPIGAEEFRPEDADAFLRTGAATLAAAGFAVEIPDGILGEHVMAEADLVPIETPDGRKGLNGSEGVPKANEKTIAAKLTIRVDGEIVDEAEIEFLLAQNSPFVFFRNRWIEVDRTVLK